MDRVSEEAAKYTVLVIEDDLYAIQFYRIYLQEDPAVRAIYVDTIADAKTALEKEPVDVVFLDKDFDKTAAAGLLVLDYINEKKGYGEGMEGHRPLVIGSSSSRLPVAGVFKDIGKEALLRELEKTKLVGLFFAGLFTQAAKAARLRPEDIPPVGPTAKPLTP